MDIEVICILAAEIREQMLISNIADTCRDGDKRSISSQHDAQQNKFSAKKLERVQASK